MFVYCEDQAVMPWNKQLITLLEQLIVLLDSYISYFARGFAERALLLS